MAWYLYIIRTVDRYLYAGVTTDVERRFEDHLAQGCRTAKFLRSHKPERLVFSQLIGSRSLALKVEYRFKRLPRRAKERIIRAGHLCFNRISGMIETS
jgi:putative endonuclease